MIMGIFIVCMPFAVKRKEFAPKGLMMLGAAVALTLGSALTGLIKVPGLEGDYHTLSTVGMIALFAIFIAFFIENFVSMKNSAVQIEPDPHSIGLQEEDDVVPSKATVGNILGANIIDLALILPICSFVSMGKGQGALVVSTGSVFDMIICVVAVSIAVIPTLFTKKLQRWQGIVSLTGYIAYVIYTFVAA